MKDSPTQSSVLQLAHPPIPIVRIGIIGLGNRGLLTLQRYLQIEGTEIKALCEIREGNLNKAQLILKEAKHPEAMGYTGPDGWRRMCECNDLDLVFVCTDWLTHTQMGNLCNGMRQTCSYRSSCRHEYSRMLATGRYSRKDKTPLYHAGKLLL